MTECSIYQRLSQSLISKSQSPFLIDGKYEGIEKTMQGSPELFSL
jgi:hypothetical protein